MKKAYKGIEVVKNLTSLRKKENNKIKEPAEQSQ